MVVKADATEGCVVVDIFANAKVISFFTTEAYGSAVLFRVDTPELPEREFILESPEYVLLDIPANDKQLPAPQEPNPSAYISNECDLGQCEDCPAEDCACSCHEGEEDGE